MLRRVFKTLKIECFFCFFKKNSIFFFFRRFFQDLWHTSNVKKRRFNFKENYILEIHLHYTFNNKEEYTWQEDIKKVNEKEKQLKNVI